MAGKGTVTIRILGDASGFQKAVGSVEGGVGKMSSSFGKIAGVASAAFGAVGLAGALKGAVDEAREAEKVGRQTAAVIESTGGVAGVTAGQVSGLAEKLSNLSGIDDELIQSAENVLLTFTNISKDAFEPAATAALNMSAALGTDLQSATIQVGKALNDPIKGVTALSKAGVSFTQQQKDQIKAMVEAGDVAGAQKIILGELGKEFGGAAEAAADPMQKLGVIVGNLQEKVGLALLPVVEKVAEWLGDNLPKALDFASDAFGKVQEAVKPLIDQATLFFNALRTGFSEDEGTPIENFALMLREQVLPIVQKVVDFLRANWQPVLIGLGAAITAFVLPPMALWVASTVAAVAPFVAIGAVIAAVAAGAIYAYGHFDKFHEIIDQLAEAAKSAFDAFTAVVDTAIVVITDLWDRFGNTLLDKIRIAFEAIMQILQGAVQTLTGIFDLIKAVLTGKWGEAWDAILQILSGVWETLMGILRLALDEISLVFEAAKAGISAAWAAIWHGIATLVTDILIDPAKSAFDSLVSFVSGLPGRITAAASGMWDGIKTAFKTAVNWLIKAWNNLEFKIPGFDPPGPGPKFGGFTLGVPDIPLLAKGGIVTKPTIAMIGEGREPEAVLPLSRLGHMGGDIYITVQVQGSVLSERDLVDVVHKGLVEKTRRNPTLQLA